MISPARLTSITFALWLALAGTGAAQSLLEDNASRLSLPPDTPFVPEEDEVSRPTRPAVPVSQYPWNNQVAGPVIDIRPPVRTQSIPALPVSLPVPAPGQSSTTAGLTSTVPNFAPMPQNYSVPSSKVMPGVMAPTGTGPV